MGRIDRLAERYKSYIALPWQKDLAGAQRAISFDYSGVKSGEDLDTNIVLQSGDVVIVP